MLKISLRAVSGRVQYSLLYSVKKQAILANGLSKKIGGNMKIVDEQVTVLLVDDSLTNLVAFSDHLAETAPHYKVVTANNGAKALAHIAQERPDIILLDVIMPEMDGFETCQRLKQNPHTADIPVIFMTSLVDTVDKVKGLNLGAVDYVTKPFQQQELVARLNTHVTISRLQKKLQVQNEWLQKEIEERRQAEVTLAQRNQALRHSEIRFQDMVMSLSDWAWEMDKSFHFTYSSGRIVELLGYQVDQVVGKTPFQFMDGRDADIYTEQLNNLLQMQAPLVDLECTLRHKDGHPVYLESNGVPTLNEAGKITGFRGASKDVTAQKQLEAISQEYRMILEQELSVQSQQLQANEEQLQEQIEERKQAETALEQSRQRLSLVEQDANDGFWDWDLNNNTIYFSKRWAQTLGLDNEPLNQHPDEMRKRIHPSDYAEFMKQLKAYLAQQQSQFHPLFRCKHAGGHYVWMLLYGTCVWDATGKPQRLLAIQVNLSSVEHLHSLLDNPPISNEIV